MFSYEQSIESDGTVRITLSGELDLAAAPLAERLLAGFAGLNVLVDLARLEFLDSSGVAVLVGAHARATEHGGTLRFTSPQGDVRRVLGVRGLLNLFRVGQLGARRRESVQAAPRTVASTARSRC